MHLTASTSRVAGKGPTWTPKRSQLGPNLGSRNGAKAILRDVEVEAKKKEEERRRGQKSEKGKYTLYDLLGGKRREVNLPSYDQTTQYTQFQ